MPSTRVYQKNIRCNNHLIQQAFDLEMAKFPAETRRWAKFLSQLYISHHKGSIILHPSLSSDFMVTAFNRLCYSFSQYWANSRINYCIRVFIALVGVAIPCWWFESSQAITPLVMGIIASALAETDDNISGRLSALFTTLLCFTVAIFSVKLLFQMPIIFTFGLLLSSFSFIMLGAMGPRYASIAFASLLIAVYTMLGSSELTPMWYQPFLLLSGASLYGIISLVWLLLWPFQPVQQNLSSVFTSLYLYLNQKNDPFFSSTDSVVQRQDAKENAMLVNALNQTKASLLNRVRRGQLSNNSRHFLKVYFIAQDIHERANSAHSNLPKLTHAFFHSDVIFRLQRLLHLQAIACLDVSRSLTLSTIYIHNKQNAIALDELNKSIEYIQTADNPEWNARLSQLEYQRQNVTTIDRQLVNIGQIETRYNDQDKEIADTDAHNFKDKMSRIKAELNLRSLLCRHAIRLSLALCAGYGIIQVFNLTHGYWILLTTLFVCQANYSATRSKLSQRIVGTTLGLLFGLPLLALFPNLTGQLVLMVLFGVLFFAFRTTHYTTATVFITLLVLMCFNQLGNGYAVMLPRLSDTLIGCLLSVTAVRYILPDWQAHRLRGIMKDAIIANRDYLAHVIAQYRVGKRDSVAYRLARREAHNKDAQLSTAITNMLAEPGRYRSAMDESFRFSCLNHTMLGYISTLGAHRIQINDDTIHNHFSSAHKEIHRELDLLIQKFSAPSDSPLSDQDKTIVSPNNFLQQEKNGAAFMVIEQLNLLHHLIFDMLNVADVLAEKSLKNAKPTTKKPST